MPTYIGFSTINANKPRSTNLNAGVDGGTGSIVQPIIFGKKFKLVDEQLVIQDRAGERIVEDLIADAQDRLAEEVN